VGKLGAKMGGRQTAPVRGTTIRPPQRVKKGGAKTREGEQEGKLFPRETPGKGKKPTFLWGPQGGDTREI